jgi:K+-transporting ATPase ATPase C chain
MSDNKHNYKPAVRLGIISLVMCGLIFPVLVTALAQILLPYQANGEIVQFHAHKVGSMLIAQNFTSPMFFHPRNASDSASGVDPHITLQDSYSQIPRISKATGISPDALKEIVDANVERTIWIVGEPYVNVLKLNLILVDKFPSSYESIVK